MTTSEKEIKAAARAIAEWLHLMHDPLDLAEEALSAAEKEREGDIIEKLREWIAAHSAFSNADGLTVLVEVEPLLVFLNDLQEQSTGGEG